ncbi:hypothetical protein [Candidatus Leptofilum sp.]|uniref:hypothetical protein n=1 Tax=Candidatus Leptofilum sp. TaxID=3241576 RepID=UPI003B5BD913
MNMNINPITTEQDSQAILHKANAQQAFVSPLGRLLEDTIAFPWQENDVMMMDTFLLQMSAKKG